MERPARDVKTRLYSCTNNAVGLWNTKISPLTEQLCWLALVALHIICAAYYAAITWCYWNLSGSLLDNWLGFGWAPNIITLSRSFTVFAGVHFFYVVWMVGWSIKKQRPVLAVYKVSARKDRLNLSVIDRCRAVFSKLGVNGPYFDLVLLLREIVETALQTNQAYRMSLLLSRSFLNRGYVALLVLNCWSTAFVHRAFHANTANRRLWALICDCVLDLVTAVGITSVLLVIYSSEFIFEQEGYASYKWYEDGWIVNVLSKYQILMVSSWGDFVMRMIFALSMVTNMNNRKALLSAKSMSSSKTLLRSSKSRTSHGIAAIVPLNPTSADVKLAHKRSSNKQVMARAEYWFAQILFFAWGALILVLHSYAESTATFAQCMMQVKPWFSSQNPR